MPFFCTEVLRRQPAQRDLRSIAEQVTRAEATINGTRKTGS